MEIIENGLIPIYNNDGNKAVNARELHEFLEVGKDFTTWIKDRIEKYGFIEDEDYIIFTEFGENSGRPKTEYILTMDTAKEISMVQNNEKGSQARKYFIAVEKKYKQGNIDTSQLSAETIAILKLSQAIAMNELAQKQIKKEVQAIRDVVEIRPSRSWRDETNKLMNNICHKLNDFQRPKDEVYKALQERGACDLKARLRNMRGRMALEGVTKTKINNLNYLDIIAEDKKLIEIYVAIVKELAIKYKVA